MFQIADNPNAAIDTGSWTDFRGAKFLIAHSGNMRFQRAMQRMQKPFRRKIEKNEMDPADQKRILIQALAEAILLDWKDVANSTGQGVPYSRELAIKALTNDDELREFVMEYSLDLANFKEAEEEYEGNS